MPCSQCTAPWHASVDARIPCLSYMASHATQLPRIAFAHLQAPSRAAPCLHHMALHVAHASYTRCTHLQTVSRSPSPLKKDSRFVDASAAIQDMAQVLFRNPTFTSCYRCQPMIDSCFHTDDNLLPHSLHHAKVVPMQLGLLLRARTDFHCYKPLAGGHTTYAPVHRLTLI